MENLKYQIKQILHIFVPLKKIELVSLFKEKNVTITSVFPSEKFYLPKYNDVFGNEYDYCKDYEIEIPEIFTFEIKKGIVITGSEEIYTSEGNVFKEITTLKENFQKNKFSSKLKNKNKYIKGSVCYLETKTDLNNNYSHFILETLPRLYIISKSGIVPDYYIIPGNKEFHKEFYELIGIDPNKILILEPNLVVQAENLIITTLLNNWEYTTYRDFKIPKRNWLNSWLKEYYQSYYNKIEPKFNKHIYISRKIASNRHIVNEDELIEIINKHNFEVIYLENYSVIEKAQLFKSATCIVSIHGAGLANTIFCNPNCTILEILSKDYLDPHYRMMAHILGLKYNYLVGEPIIKEGFTPITEDIYVDPKSFEFSIDNILHT
jgi:hypothetical protein